MRRLRENSKAKGPFDAWHPMVLKLPLFSRHHSGESGSEKVPRGVSMSGGKSQEQSSQQEGQSSREPTKRTKGVQNESLQIEFQQPPSGRWPTLLCKAPRQKATISRSSARLTMRVVGNWLAFRSPGLTSKSCRADAGHPGRQKAQRALSKIAEYPFVRESPRASRESDGTTPGSDSYSVPVTGL